MFLILCFFCVLCYYCLKRDYWESRGVQCYKPSIVKSALSLIFKTESMHDKIRFLYENYSTQPYVGVSVLNIKHILFIRSPELLKTLYSRDSDKFVNRSSKLGSSSDIIAHKSIFFATDEKWRNIRANFASAFTPIRIKLMFGLIKDCVADLELYIKKQNGEIDLEECFKRFTVDVIFSCAFGADANCLADEKSEVYVNALRLLDLDSFKRNFSILCFLCCQSLVGLLKLSFLDRDSMKYFACAIKEVLEQRRRGLKRSDIMEKLIEISKLDNFDEDDIVAQAASSLVAGIQPTSLTISVILYELAINENIQNQLREEINDVCAKHGDLSYEALQDMKYLEMVIYEGLRKYPPGAFIVREASEDYTFQETGLKIEKHTTVVFPHDAFFHDPLYFPEPEIFDPERFNCENKDKSLSVFFPFLMGPRKCIAKLFALSEVKVAITFLIRNYKIERGDKTQVPLEMKKTSMLTEPANGIFVKIAKI